MEEVVENPFITPPEGMPPTFWKMPTEMLKRIIERKNGAKPFKKIKGLRRERSSIKPYPRPGAGDMKTVGKTVYQVQANGEWRKITVLE